MKTKKKVVPGKEKLAKPVVITHRDSDRLRRLEKEMGMTQELLEVKYEYVVIRMPSVSGREVSYAGFEVKMGEGDAKKLRAYLGRLGEALPGRVNIFKDYEAAEGELYFVEFQPHTFGGGDNLLDLSCEMIKVTRKEIKNFCGGQSF